MAAGVIVVFGLVAVVLLKLMPVPHRDVDYMVVGALATLVSMGLLFFILLKTTLKGQDVFSKKRKGDG